jgi:polyhydroxybutyrate depolymerase
VLFHGFGSDPADVSSLTGLPVRGAGRGWVVAVPHLQPGESGWNLGPGSTDEAFVSALVARLDATRCLDRRAVFLSGFSSGAAFAIAYGCRHERQVAALATVAVDFQLGCRSPLSLLAFHGTADPLVPYADGAVGLSLPGVHVTGTQRNLVAWAGLDRCRPTSTRVRVGSQVVRQVWHGCAPGIRLELVTIEGGGHTWPGADPARGLGLTTRQVGATAAILTFSAVRAGREG